MRESLQSLIDKADRSLKAAQRLLDEKDFDFSASRSYYAMFYMAEALLFSKGLSFSKHSAVISAFYEHFVRPGIFPKELHQAFHEAFEQRQEGEYGFTRPFPEEEAQALLQKAKEFVEELKGHLVKGF